MNFFYTLFLTSVFLFPSLSFAQQTYTKGIASIHKPELSRSYIDSYWTKERIENAKPMSREYTIGADGKITKVNREERLPIQNYDKSKNRETNPIVGRLYFTIPGVGDHICSASVVKARIEDIGIENQNMVSTAAHCLGEDGEYFTNFVFIPDQRGERWYVRFVGTFVEWMDDSNDFNWDQGFLAMEERDDGYPISYILGYYQPWFSNGSGIGLDVTTYGFIGGLPGLDTCEGRTFGIIWYDHMSLTPEDCNGNENIEGTSGGPWTTGYKVHGVFNAFLTLPFGYMYYLSEPFDEHTKDLLTELARIRCPSGC